MDEAKLGHKVVSGAAGSNLASLHSSAKLTQAEKAPAQDAAKLSPGSVGREKESPGQGCGHAASQHSRAKERKPRPRMRQAASQHSRAKERQEAPAKDAAKPPPSTVGRKKS